MTIKHAMQRGLFRCVKREQAQGEEEVIVMAEEYRCPYCCHEHYRLIECAEYVQSQRERWGIHVLDWRWLVGREEGPDATAMQYADVVPEGAQEESREEWNAKVDAILAKVHRWLAMTSKRVKEPEAGIEEEANTER